MSDRWYLVGSADMVPPREGKRVRFNEFELALFNVGDGFLAVDNRCPHKAGPLSDGIVSGRSVFCPLHNWKISLENGCALSGGQGGVRSYPVKVSDGKVYVAFEDGRLGDSSAHCVEEARTAE